MTMPRIRSPQPARLFMAAATIGLALGAAWAAPAGAADAPPAGPAPLVVYFDSGSATLRPQDMAVLDKASRLYTDARPIVMIVSGSTDSTGSPDVNLALSQRRAEAVLRGLVARGIPEERFQVLAKAATDPAVATPKGVEEPKNRRVEIAWR